MSYLFDNRLPPRFWKRVQLWGIAECWDWVGAKQNTGYGQFWNGARMQAAHRASYETLVAPIPAGLEIDHICRNRSCVRPDHLEPVTHQENMRRSDVGKLTAARALAKTNCPSGHAYDEKNTYRSPTTGSRFCRACARKKQQLMREARKGTK